MSLGSATQVGDQPNADFEQIGKACLDGGTVVIAAAGNESSRPGHVAPVGSPATPRPSWRWRARQGARPAPFSCGGVNPGQDVDIAAPGVDVLSSLPGNRYGRLSGNQHGNATCLRGCRLDRAIRCKVQGPSLVERLVELAGPLPHPARDVARGCCWRPTWWRWQAPAGGGRCLALDVRELVGHEWRAYE